MMDADSIIKRLLVKVRRTNSQAAEVPGLTACRGGGPSSIAWFLLALQHFLLKVTSSEGWCMGAKLHNPSSPEHLIQVAGLSARCCAGSSHPMSPTQNFSCWQQRRLVGALEGAHAR